MSDQPTPTPSAADLRVSASSRLRVLFLAACLLLVTLAAYWPSFPGPFTWDDDRYVTNLPVLTTPGGLVKIWTDYRAIPDFYPLTFTALWAEYRFFAEHPLGYHVTNAVLHGLVAIAAWALLRRLGLKSAWLAAFIFAVHPVMVESVAWITEIKNILSLLFALLAAERYLAFAGVEPDAPLAPASSRRRWGAYATGLFFLACALLSKSAVCTLPVILALLIWLKKPADLKRRALDLLPWLALSLAIAAMTAFVEHQHVNARVELQQISLPERAFIAGRAVMFYLGKLLWPDPILIVYPRWNPAAIGEQLPYALGLIVLLAALALLMKKIGKAPLVALLIYIIALGPTLGFVSYFTMWYSFVFDHYQYFGALAIIALVAEIAWLAVGWIKAHAPQDRQPMIRLLASLCVAVAVLTLGSLTYGYAAMWGFPESLWRFTVDNNPRAFIALQNLAIHITERKNIERNEPVSTRYDESIDLLKRAIGVEPGDHRPYMILAQLYNWKGDYATAMTYYRRSRELMPADVKARNQGYQIQEGGTQPRAVIGDGESQTPLEDFSQPYQAGRTLEKLGEFAGAIARYQDALTQNPQNVSAMIGLGRCRIALNQMDQALIVLKQATAQAPTNKSAWAELAKVYRWGGQTQLADEAAAKSK